MNNNENKFIELKSSGRLPSIKGVALSLLEATSKDDISMELIAQIIMPDPALTARLISISNSALYPGARPIASLSDAIKKLGLAQVRQVSLGFALIRENKTGSCSKFNYSQFWIGSIFQGSLLRQICLLLKLGYAEELFTLGLLANIGTLALATAYPEQYATLLSQERDEQSLDKAELSRFGISSRELSAALIDEWRMPKPFSEALRYKKKDGAIPSGRIAGLAVLIDLSNTIAKEWAQEDMSLDLLVSRFHHLFEKLTEVDGFCKKPSEDDVLCIANAALSDAFAWTQSLGLKASREPHSKAPVPPRLITHEPKGLTSALADDLLSTIDTPSPVRVLVGSSDAVALRILAQAAGSRGGVLQALRSRDAFFEEIIEFKPHAVFIDFEPSSSFHALLQSVKNSDFGREIFIVVLARADQEPKVAQSLVHGVDDYMIRPFGLVAALSKMSIAEKMALIAKRGKEAKDSIRRYALELETANKKLSRNSLVDSLTGMPNKLLFMDRLGRAIAAGSATGKPTLIALVSLENIKQINESFGHGAGDDAILQMGEKFKRALTVTDTAARLDGNEFALIIRSIHDTDDLKRKLNELVEALHQPISIMGREFSVSCAIGSAIHPDNGSTVDDILRNAVSALRRAKESGKGKLKFYHESFAEDNRRRFGIETALSSALEKNEFEIFFQPRINMTLGRVGGAEALLRWNSHTLGPVSPEQFIPVAEECGIMNSIGDWVLDEALRISKCWIERDNNFQIAVNLSAKQFEDGALPEKVARAMQKAGFSPKNLELEITESAAMSDIHHTSKTLDSLKLMGLAISLDDFGAGYSSLGYLKKLPFDIIKIDKSFIMHAMEDKDDRAISSMIAQLARSMGKGLVAEGIETQALIDFSKSIGANWGQGFFYSKPVNVHDFEKLINKHWV